MTEPQLLLASTVARMLGVKTATLRKWRVQGRGPQGAIRASKTVVLYDANEVQAFIKGLQLRAATAPQKGRSRDEERPHE